ncbi:MAG TPA: 6-phosphogluconolactonase [Candidatus Limnocylindrales bacterium]
MARLVVVSDAGAVAEAAADRVVAVLGGAIEMRGVAHLALTGGSSAAALYEALLDPIRRSAVDWPRVEAWWGDDRLVDRSDPHSNVLAAQPILEPEHGLGLDPRRVHPFPIDVAAAGGHEAAWVAETYAARLRERLPSDLAGDPILDLVLLGMGGDGHMLSVFPGSPALEPGTPIVMAVPAPTHIEPHLARVTINPRLVAAARAVLVMCSGAAKADRLAEVLEGPIDPRLLPAQVACGANATWIVDRAAASGLREA